MWTCRGQRTAVPARVYKHYIPGSAGGCSSFCLPTEGALGWQCAAGGSCRKRLVDPPTSSGSPADGTQLAGIFPLAPAKFPPLGGEPKRPEFELAGCPWDEVCSSPGCSFLICKTHRMQTCPWQCPHLDSRIFLIFRSEPLPISHTLYGSPLSQGKYSAPLVGT